MSEQCHNVKKSLFSKTAHHCGSATSEYYFKQRWRGFPVQSHAKHIPPATESVATLPPFGPIEGLKWFDQIPSQWESQKNRFALIYFGKIQFLPPCIWNIPFMSYRLRIMQGDTTSTAQQAKSIRPKFRYLRAMKISEKTASQIWDMNWLWPFPIPTACPTIISRLPRFPSTYLPWLSVSLVLEVCSCLPN